MYVTLLGDFIVSFKMHQYIFLHSPAVLNYLHYCIVSLLTGVACLPVQLCYCTVWWLNAKLPAVR